MKSIKRIYLNEVQAAFAMNNSHVLFPLMEKVYGPKYSIFFDWFTTSGGKEVYYIDIVPFDFNFQKHGIFDEEKQIFITYDAIELEKQYVD